MSFRVVGVVGVSKVRAPKFCFSLASPILPKASRQKAKSLDLGACSQIDPLLNSRPTRKMGATADRMDDNAAIAAVASAGRTTQRGCHSPCACTMRESADLLFFSRADRVTLPWRTPRCAPKPAFDTIDFRSDPAGGPLCSLSPAEAQDAITDSLF